MHGVLGQRVRGGAHGCAGRAPGWSHIQSISGLCQEDLGPEDPVGHTRRAWGCPEGLGSGPHALLAHPQEVIIHQKQPLKACCVVQDHSGRTKPAFHLS